MAYDTLTPPDFQQLFHEALPPPQPDLDPVRRGQLECKQVIAAVLRAQQLSGQLAGTAIVAAA